MEPLLTPPRPGRTAAEPQRFAPAGGENSGQRLFQFIVQLGPQRWLTHHCKELGIWTEFHLYREISGCFAGLGQDLLSSCNTGLGVVDKLFGRQALVDGIIP
jgi:hypothetical protein